jgi:hypothetical protein
VVVHPPQIVTIERGEGAVQREYLQPVLWEIQVADDLRAQEAHDVGGNAEPEPREDLLRDGRAPKDVTPLQNQDRPARLREICGRNQAVVPATYHDRVVPFRADLLERTLGRAPDTLGRVRSAA